MLFTSHHPTITLAAPGSWKGNHDNHMDIESGYDISGEEPWDDSSDISRSIAY
jgi:hypothetical protein